MFLLCFFRILADVICHLIDKSDVDWSFQPDPSWLCCVPLLHFLRGASDPFSECHPLVDFKKDTWWGISDFVRRKNSFKFAVKQYGYVNLILVLCCLSRCLRQA